MRRSTHLDTADATLGLSFVGLLFTGVMLTPTGPKCLEYNVRFGDPETETLLALIAPETDLAEIFLVRRTERFALG